jgi:hypothetical protein
MVLARESSPGSLDRRRAGIDVDAQHLERGTGRHAEMLLGGSGRFDPDEWLRA